MPRMPHPPRLPNCLPSHSRTPSPPLPNPRTPKLLTPTPPMPPTPPPPPTRRPGPPAASLRAARWRHPPEGCRCCNSGSIAQRTKAGAAAPRHRACGRSQQLPMVHLDGAPGLSLACSMVGRPCFAAAQQWPAAVLRGAYPLAASSTRLSAPLSCSHVPCPRPVHVSPMHLPLRPAAFHVQHSAAKGAEQCGR